MNKGKSITEFQDVCRVWGLDLRAQGLGLKGLGFRDLGISQRVWAEGDGRSLKPFLSRKKTRVTRSVRVPLERI